MEKHGPHDGLMKVLPARGDSTAATAVWCRETDFRVDGRYPAKRQGMPCGTLPRRGFRVRLRDFATWGVTARCTHATTGFNGFLRGCKRGTSSSRWLGRDPTVESARDSTKSRNARSEI